MKYLGMDVHSKATVWCLLDENGKLCGQGRVATTVNGLQRLSASWVAERGCWQRKRWARRLTSSTTSWRVAV